jgi:transposase
MPGGRPSKYRPEYCDLLIAHMAKGFSFESFAADVNTSFETLYNWCKIYPEFLEAKAQGRSKGIKFWEGLGIAGAAGKVKNFQPAVWIYSMKCRFPKQWLEQVVARDNGIEPAALVLNYARKPKAARAVIESETERLAIEEAEALPGATPNDASAGDETGDGDAC